MSTIASHPHPLEAPASPTRIPGRSPHRSAVLRHSRSWAAHLEKACLAVVWGFGELMESSDRYTFGHCERVAAFAADIAGVLGLEQLQLTTVRIGAYLHDLGKVRVPREILNKPGRLAPAELETIRKHPEWGVELLAAVELPWDIAPIIRWHHERYDGTGYPDGLCGAEIPINAQIIGIADAYDAITTTRSYRPAMPKRQALEEMRINRRHWHADVYAAFVKSVTHRRLAHASSRFDGMPGQGAA